MEPLPRSRSLRAADGAPAPRPLTKRTLASVSHAIERTAVELGDEATVLAAFQYRGYFDSVRRTYDDLVGHGVTAVTAYVGAAVPDQRPVHVALAGDEPLTECWSVVLVSPTLCAYVWATDRHQLGDGTPGLEPARLFDAEIGFDPLRAASLVERFLHASDERIDPALAARLRHVATRRAVAPTTPQQRAWAAGLSVLCDRIEASATAIRAEAALATRDPLTGVFNREGLRRWAGGDLDLPVPPIGVVMIDLDGFKQINDTYGHTVGDRVLVGVADAIVAQVRPHDLVVRWGGDEFVVLCPGQSGDHLAAIVERIADAVARVDVDGIRPTASFGTQVSRSRPFTFETADAMLYAAKHDRSLTLR